MSTPYIGEIRILPYSRGAPSGWQACDGSLLSISGNETLFQLIGTTYGGDGNSNFGVPDLRGRVPVHQGNGQGLTPRPLGAAGGSEAVTLTSVQMGPHSHAMLASTAVATASSPDKMVLATLPSTVADTLYALAPSASEAVTFPATMLQPAGGGQAHDNTAPTLTLRYCIATIGIWPSQS